MTAETKLAEMLATRLCHDLTGPIGAVNNGAEFLEEEGFDMQNEAVQLILSSAQEAVNRLQFYRQAYGRVGETGEACLADKKKITTDFFARTKVKIDWPDSHTDASGVAISQKMSRLLLNLLIIGGASLIRGGNLAVRIEQTEDGTKYLRIQAAGDVIKIDPETIQILENKGDSVPLTPKTAQPFLAHVLASDLGAHVQLNQGEGQLELLVTQRVPALATV